MDKPGSPPLSRRISSTTDIPRSPPTGIPCIFPPTTPTAGAATTSIPPTGSPTAVESDPKLLSRAVNTPETSSSHRSTGIRFYFSSDSHQGMGELDIFKIFQMSDDNWSSPYNLKPPVNSGADDFGFVITERAPEGRSACRLISAPTATAGRGATIFTWPKKGNPSAAPPVEPSKPIVYQMFLDVYVLEKVYQQPDNPNSPVLGRKTLAGVQLRIGDNGNATTVTPGEDGLWSIELKENASYDCVASKKIEQGSSPSSPTGTIPPTSPRPALGLQIGSNYVDKEITLKWTQPLGDPPTMQTTLNKLHRDLLLKPRDPPSITHTNSKNNPSPTRALPKASTMSHDCHHQQLGEARLGEEVPAVECICAECTEAQHQTNRRTTFTIIE